MTRLRIGCKQAWPCFEQGRFFPVERASRDDEAQTRRPSLQNSRVASASCAARTSNFRFPATVTYSGRQPRAPRRSASFRFAPAPG